MLKYYCDDWIDLKKVAKYYDEDSIYNRNDMKRFYLVKIRKVIILNCPYCDEELKVHDYYGKTAYAEHYYIYPQSWIEKEGDIYKCDNEECEMYEESFYTDKAETLHEGYPC